MVFSRYFEVYNHDVTESSRLRRGVMPTLGVSHVSICVSDLEKSLAFYRDLLGFPNRGRAWR